MLQIFSGVGTRTCRLWDDVDFKEIKVKSRESKTKLGMTNVGKSVSLHGYSKQEHDPLLVVLLPALI